MQRSLDAGPPSDLRSPPRSPALAFAPAGAVAGGDARALRATIDLVPVGVANFDRHGRFLLVNDRLCTILGRQRDELLARTFQEVALADDLPRSLALLEQFAASAAASCSHETRLVRADGSVVSARVTVSAVRRAGDDDIDVYLAIVEDVAGERASEQTRRRAEERLRIALDAAATGTFRWDSRTNECDWDEALVRLFGLEPQEVRSVEQVIARVHPEDLPRMQEAWRRCALEGTELDEEFRVVWPDGSIHWLRDKGRTVSGVDGAPLFLTGACTDVTASRDLSERFREASTLFRRLSDANLFGVCVADQAGVREANDEFLRLAGTTREAFEARGVDWQAITPPEHLSRDWRALQEMLERGACTPFEKEYVWADGTRVPILVGGALLAHEPLRWVAFALDLTQRYETEREHERVLALERSARAAAERASRLRDDVLGVVAHDLRNPVHTIVMSASTLLDIPLPEEQRARQLGIIQRTAKGMHHLISDLLDVTRIESGSFAIQWAPVDVNALLDEMLELFTPRAEACAIALTREVAPAIPPLEGDHDRLVQLLSNLLDNALKFTPAGGRIGLRACRLDDYVRISVEDSGCGIPAESLPYVFDRFWQADRTSRAGAGLGLAIARGIVRAHGGEITVESTLGRGTTFHLTLALPASEGRDAAS